MPESDSGPVSFDEWSMVLEGESFDAASRERCRRCIVAYLHYLKERGERPSVASAKAHIESGEAKGVTDTLARDALRAAHGLIRQVGDHKSAFYEPIGGS